MANYTKHLDDLKDVLRVYYEENGEIVEIGTDTEVNPYYTVDYNTKIVSVFNLDDFTPKIDYTSTDAQDDVKLDLNAIGAVDVNSVMNNGLPTGYTIEDGKIIVDSVQAGDSISVNYDLERIKIGALEYEDGDKTKNPILYGMRIRNSQGENVFTTDDKGDIHMTGTVNARAGNFSGNVLVGNEEDKYIVLSTELEDEPVIASSDYVNNRNQGWVINGSGDAIFNNITARGAIKTAVFEYEEIEAVGGAFLFRPSSTIRNAWIENPIEETVTAVISESTCTWTLPEGIDLPFTITVYSSDLEDFTNATIDSGLNVIVLNEQSYNFIYYNVAKTLTTFSSALETLSPDIVIKSTGANLIVEVEKPQFKTGDWVKVDNFKDGDATTASGLAAIYEVEQYSYIEDGVVVVEDPTRLILIGAAEYYFDNPEDLIGGALISLGGNNDNYGIGINSGDGDILLPPRAISLFESTINPEANPKVSFDYTGILGTLPEIKDGQLPLDVDEEIYQNMDGTQGIYTNNMYIGDANQYVAFYTVKDSDPVEKKLDIAAGSISVGMGIDNPLYLIGNEDGVALYRGNKVDSVEEITTSNLLLTEDSLQLRKGNDSFFRVDYEGDSEVEVNINITYAETSSANRPTTVIITDVNELDNVDTNQNFKIGFMYADIYSVNSGAAVSYMKYLTKDETYTSSSLVTDILVNGGWGSYTAILKILGNFSFTKGQSMSLSNEYQVKYAVPYNPYQVTVDFTNVYYDGDKTFEITVDSNNNLISGVTLTNGNLIFQNLYTTQNIFGPSLVFGNLPNLATLQNRGIFSSSFGKGLFSAGESQTVVGKYNVIDNTGQYAFIVGNGQDEGIRTNAFGVDWNGDILTASGAKIEWGIEPGYQSKYINFKDEKFVGNNISSKSDNGYITNLSISSDNKNLKLMTANNEWNTSSTIWDVDMTKVRETEFLYKSGSYTNTTTNWENVNLSITVPSGYVYLIWLYTGWGTGRPEGLGIHSNSTLGNAGVPNHNVVASGSQYSPMFVVTSGTYYAFVKRGTANTTHTTYLYAIKMKYPGSWSNA